MPANPNLLRAPKKRKQVSLALPESTAVQTPRVASGHYQVVTPSVAPKADVSKLIAGLGQFASAGLSALNADRQKQDQEIAEVVSSFSPEEAKVLLSGDSEAIEDQLGDTISKLDKAQRKGVLRFIDNPQNYIRANRALGVTLAQNFLVDIQSNPAEYTHGDEPVAEQLEKARQEITESTDEHSLALNGASLTAFNQIARDGFAKLIPTLEDQRNENAKDQYLTGVTNALTGFMQGGVTDADSFLYEYKTELNGHTPDEQLSVITNVFDALISRGDVEGASAYVELLETGDVLIGRNAPLAETLVAGFAYRLDQREEQLDNKERAKANLSVQSFGTTFQSKLAGIAANREVGDWVHKTASGEIIEFRGPEEDEDIASYVGYVQETLYENQDVLSSGEVAILTSLQDNVEQAATAPFRFAEGVGAASFGPDLRNTLSEKGAFGDNLFGMSDEDINKEVALLEDELYEKLDSVYNNPDPEMTPTKKALEGRRLVEQARKEALQRSKVIKDAQDKEMIATRILDSHQLGATSSIPSNIIASYGQEKDEFGGAVADPERMEFVTKDAHEFFEGLQAEARAIWDRPLTEEEQSLSQFEVANLRRSEISELRNTEVAMYNFGLAQRLETKDSEKVAATEYKSLKERLEKIQDIKTRYLSVLDQPSHADSSIAIIDHIEERIEYLVTEAPVVGANQRDSFTRASLLRDGVRSKVGRSYYDYHVRDRIYNEGEQPITLNELNTGKFKGLIKMDPASLNWRSEPIVNLQTLASAADGNETAQGYIMDVMSALKRDDDELDPYNPEHQSNFVNAQLSLYLDEFGLSTKHVDEEAIHKAKTEATKQTFKD